MGAIKSLRMDGWHSVISSCGECEAMLWWASRRGDWTQPCSLCCKNRAPSSELNAQMAVKRDEPQEWGVHIGHLQGSDIWPNLSVADRDQSSDKACGGCDAARQEMQLTKHMRFLLRDREMRPRVGWTRVNRPKSVTTRFQPPGDNSNTRS